MDPVHHVLVGHPGASIDYGDVEVPLYLLLEANEAGFHGRGVGAPKSARFRQEKAADRDLPVPAECQQLAQGPVSDSTNLEALENAPVILGYFLVHSRLPLAGLSR